MAKWKIFNYVDTGPFILIISDCEWFTSNRIKIDEWFDNNYPMIKPSTIDTVIRFNDSSQVTAWRLTWED